MTYIPNLINNAAVKYTGEAVSTSDRKDKSVTYRLPTDATERKKTPLWSGLVQYFPDALVAVAQLSQKGNDQHNKNEPLHWSREKSSDHHDTLLRHLFDSGTVDTDGVRHSTKCAWRALAVLQLELEKAQAESRPCKQVAQAEQLLDYEAIRASAKKYVQKEEEMPF